MSRFCQRGHELIAGETAYVVSVWTWCSPTRCRRLANEAAHASDTSGNVRWNPDVGKSARWAKGAGAWEHRKAELRCRICNRDRVARYRAKRKQAVMGGGKSTNFTTT